jgi:hypothetical protein
MNDDEMFARELRDQVDRVAPSIDVNTDAVVPRARRRRTRRVAATGVASALTVALVGGWAATAQPWTPDVQVIVPAGSGSSTPGPSSYPSPSPSAPGAGPSSYPSPSPSAPGAGPSSYPSPSPSAPGVDG